MFLYDGKFIMVVVVLLWIKVDVIVFDGDVYLVVGLVV